MQAFLAGWAGSRIFTPPIKKGRPSSLFGNGVCTETALLYAGAGVPEFFTVNCFWENTGLRFHPFMQGCRTEWCGQFFLKPMFRVGSICPYGDGKHKIRGEKPFHSTGFWEYTPLFEESSVPKKSK